jgi:hypothetical protein
MFKDSRVSRIQEFQGFKSFKGSRGKDMRLRHELSLELEEKKSFSV